MSLSWVRHVDSLTLIDRCFLSKPYHTIDLWVRVLLCGVCNQPQYFLEWRAESMVALPYWTNASPGVMTNIPNLSLIHRVIVLQVLKGIVIVSNDCAFTMYASCRWSSRLSSVFHNLLVSPPEEMMVHATNHCLFGIVKYTQYAYFFHCYLCLIERKLL